MLRFDEGIKDKWKLKSKEMKTEKMGPGLGFSTLTLTHNTATGLLSKYLEMVGELFSPLFPFNIALFVSNMELF